MKISVCFASKIVQKYQWNFTDLPQILYANMWVCLYVYWFHSVQLAFFELVFLNFLPPHTIWFDAMFWSISFTLTSTHHTQNLIEIFFQTDLFLFRYFFLFLAHFFHLFSSLYYVPNTRIVNEIFNIFYLDLKTIHFIRCVNGAIGLQIIFVDTKKKWMAKMKLSMDAIENIFNTTKIII